MSSQRESFGALLRGHRLAAGLTQEALAARAGLSSRGIADLERGVRRAPYRHTVVQLAEALELDSAQRDALFLASQQARRVVSRPMQTEPATLAGWEEPLTDFVGRQREISDIQRLLATTRLLTLIGPGGVGKTRLALRTAARAKAEYPNGVHVAELAATTHADLVGHAVAFRLGITQEQHRSVSDSLVDALRLKTMLLVLDNCEHLVQACAELVHTLLRGCPGLRILATSREPLGVESETIWSVPPMALAASDAPLQAQTESDAVRLFLDRVRAVRPDFVLDERTASAVLGICRALEGMPLALELAAARMRVMEPDEVRARLSQALPLLTASSRTAPPRQRTMRATLDWSYALLSEDEQRLLAQLAVFIGGWTLQAAEEVFAADVLNVLTSLVDKSLVAVERHDRRSRYRFLEPVRQYAEERLVERGDLGSMRGRHALYYTGVAEQAAPPMVGHITGSDLARLLNLLEREHDNFRAALQWLTQHGDAESSLRLAGALHWFWLLRGYATEGREWVRRALDTPGSQPSRGRAGALVAAGSLAAFQHDFETARACLEAAVAAWTEIGDNGGIAVALLNLSQTELSSGNTERAAALLHRSLELFRALNDDSGTAACLYRLGDLAATLGDFDRARALTEESLVLSRSCGDAYRISSALHVLGHLAYERGDIRTASTLLSDGLASAAELGDRRGVAICLESAALVADVRGHPERAARLFGAAAGLRAVTLAGRRTWLQSAYLRGVDAVRGTLGEVLFDNAWAAGGALSVSSAVAEALAFLQSPAGNGRAIICPST